ncbi:MAG TPA: anthranilate phosphoribosyltransferase [Acidimicrobiales bacterium]|nr:anthranilate phosphoribosyltransferase [Acidimicrobiales bacterium]
MSDQADAFVAAGGWPAVLSRLVGGGDLDAEEAALAFGEILTGAATPAQIAAFVVALRAKGETVPEMTGLVRTMLAHAEAVPVTGDLVDTCGTGGDRSRSVNVSTMAALVVAGAGARVCKHGGRAATSAAGSADVLEALGVVIDLGPTGVARCIEEVGMGFCFAPRFHPAMRHAIPVRRELGVATVFNFLGPLANPARATMQVVGVSDAAMAEKMLGVLVANGCRHAMVVHGADGLDELSTTGPSSVLEWRHGEVRRYGVDPADLGLAPASLGDLVGGDAAHNAEVVRRVLAGEPGPARDIAVLNAAAGLVVAGVAPDLAAGVARAGAVIDEGAAAAVLEALVRVSQEAAATA